VQRRAGKLTQVNKGMLVGKGGWVGGGVGVTFQTTATRPITPKATATLTANDMTKSEGK